MTATPSFYLLVALTDAAPSDESLATRLCHSTAAAGFQGLMITAGSLSDPADPEQLLTLWRKAAEDTVLSLWWRADTREATAACLAAHPRNRERLLVPEGQSDSLVERELSSAEVASLDLNPFLRQHVERVVASGSSSLAGILTELCLPEELPAPPCFFAGESFCGEFRDRCRYDLRQRLAALTADTEDRLRVLLDYHSVRADLAFRSLSTLKTEAERQRHELEVGPFPPVTGEVSRDLWTGTADYFRFASLTATGAFVSLASDRPAEQHWRLALARSLAKFHPRQASWVFGEPAAFQSEATCTEILMASHRHVVVGGRIEEALAQLEGGSLGVPTDWISKRDFVLSHAPSPMVKANVAVVYNWRVPAVLSMEDARAYQDSLVGLTVSLAKAGIAFDIIAPELMTTAEEPTDDGGFRRREEVYDGVLYPWPLVHDRLDWEVLCEFIAQGGRALSYGRAPAALTDGTPIADGVAQLFDGGLDADDGGHQLSRTGKSLHCAEDLGREAPERVLQALQEIGIPRLYEVPAGNAAALRGSVLFLASRTESPVQGPVRVGNRDYIVDRPTSLCAIDTTTGKIATWD